jgi:hypothetical protein
LRQTYDILEKTAFDFIISLIIQKKKTNTDEQIEAENIMPEDEKSLAQEARLANNAIIND